MKSPEGFNADEPRSRPEHPGHRPLFEPGADGINVVAFADPEEVDTLTPVVSMLRMIFLLSLRDDASALEFLITSGGHDGPSIELAYHIDDERHELEPPPGHLAGEIAGHLDRLVGLTTHRRRLAIAMRRLANRIERGRMPVGFGRFRFRFPGCEVEGDASVAVIDAERGVQYLITLPSPSGKAPGRSADVINASGPSDGDAREAEG